MGVTVHRFRIGSILGTRYRSIRRSCRAPPVRLPRRLAGGAERGVPQRAPGRRSRDRGGLDGATPWLLGAVAALGLFAGVVIHEPGHSVVALQFGYVIEAITLWSLGGIASSAEMPERWRQELLVSVAGPLVSVPLGVVCIDGFRSLPGGFYAGRFVLASATWRSRTWR